MIPTLPRDDRDPEARSRRLATVRDELRYVWDRPPGVAAAEDVPRRLGYPVGVVARIGLLTAEMAANRVARQHRSPGSTSCRDLFATIAPPPVADAPTSEADRWFAWQRIGGANPLVIARATSVPDGFGALGEAAAAEGRLYVADYAKLGDLRPGTGGGRQKVLGAPRALFVADGGRLTPLAIHADGAVVTPRDAGWPLARLLVQAADCNLHQIYHHLGRAHFLLEAFALATERQLDEHHPLFVLLSPHFHGTIAINGAARDQLVVPGGQLETLLAPVLDDALGLVRQAVQDVRLPESTFEADLAARGMDDDTLPDYPFRDDGRLIHAAIHAWVADYVAIYYPGTAELAGDTELHAWLSELRSPDGGRVSGLPSRLEDPEDLTRLLTFVLFQASAQHAVLNYSQFDWMGWVPNMPSAAYAGADPLPPPALAAEQLDFYYQQANVRDNRLGDYPVLHFRDRRVADPLDAFQRRLADAGRIIAERNPGRLQPYPYLVPENLTASIHI